MSIKPVNLVFVEDNPDLRNDIQFQLNANGINITAKVKQYYTSL